MMKRTLFFFATALFALTCLVLAGKFWENTAYQDWTDKRYLGMNTTWYLHSHFVCCKLL